VVQKYSAGVALPRPGRKRPSIRILDGNPPSTHGFGGTLMDPRCLYAEEASSALMIRGL